jgi:hypothetical protein
VAAGTGKTAARSASVNGGIGVRLSVGAAGCIWPSSMLHLAVVHAGHLAVIHALHVMGGRYR